MEKCVKIKGNIYEKNAKKERLRFSLSKEMMSEENLQPENRMGYAPVKGLLLKMSFPLMISMFVQAAYNIVDSMFQEAGFSPNLYMENQSYTQIQEMVARGAGITLAPMVTWANDSRDDLVYVPLSDVKRTRYLYLRVPENAPTSPKVDALKKFLIDYFAEACKE